MAWQGLNPGFRGEIPDKPTTQAMPCTRRS